MTAEAHSYPAGCAFGGPEDIAGKHVTVMGLGLNGGGEASVRFFLDHGAYVTVTDMKTREQLAPTMAALAPEIGRYGGRLRFVLGRHDIADFSGADVVIKNPGVKFEGNEYLAASRAVETDLSVFLRFTDAPIVAVTGSKGKSSTVSAIHYGLVRAGMDAFLGGNITVSPLGFLDRTNGTTPVVLELSSWQLADLRGRGLLRPEIALITAIVPDHQNWYGGMEGYVADKKLIYSSQDADCWTICQSADKWGDVFASETPGRVLRSGRAPLKDGELGAWLDADGRGFARLPGAHGAKEMLVLDGLSVPGGHMRVNALNAALVMSLLGVPAGETRRILAAWPGIRHRLEYFHCWERNGGKVRFYNDSAATVPEASAAALSAFLPGDAPVHFVCGGTDKGLDFSPLAEALAEARPASLHLLDGTGTDKLVPLLEQSSVPFCGPFGSLRELLSALKELVAARTDAAGSVVVFSPGATSFGMFRNEFDRGDSYKAAVAELF